VHRASAVTEVHDASSYGCPFVSAPASHCGRVAQVCNAEHRRALELRDSLSHTLPMQKTLPKRHTSCLSSEFKYPSATHTDLGKTFARIKRQLKGQSEVDRENVCPLPARKTR
jgi:hypothetical protein